MLPSRGHWLAIVTLVGTGCQPESPPAPPPPPPVTCATVDLVAPLEFDSGLTTANVARVVVTESRLWVAYTYPLDALTGDSEVRLVSFDCATKSIEPRERPNAELVAADKLLASASADRLLLGWDGVNAAAAPVLRSYDLQTGQPDAAKPLILSGADETSQAAHRLSSLRPLTSGGFVLTGTTDAVDGTCAQPFLQQLDSSGTPVGGFVDINAGGFGRCTRTIAPLQQDADGSLILNWVSSDEVGSSASWNNLSLSLELLGGETQTYLQLPSINGIDPTGLADLAGAAASVDLTIGSEASRAAGPWQPQFMVLPSQPANEPSRFVLRDVLQPDMARVSQVIEVRDGTIQSPRLLSTAQGGLLAWTLVAGDPLAEASLLAIRFAYNGDRWKVGERFSLVPAGPGQMLHDIVSVTGDRYFVLWTERVGETRSLKGAFVQP